MAALFPFAYIGVRYHGDLFVDTANMIGLFISGPVEFLFGRGEDVPITGLVAIALFEMNAAAFLIYLILSAWDKRK